MHRAERRIESTNRNFTYTQTTERVLGVFHDIQNTSQPTVLTVGKDNPLRLLRTLSLPSTGSGSDCRVIKKIQIPLNPPLKGGKRACEQGDLYFLVLK